MCKGSFNYASAVGEYASSAAIHVFVEAVARISQHCLYCTGRQELEVLAHTVYISMELYGHVVTRFYCIHFCGPHKIFPALKFSYSIDFSDCGASIHPTQNWSTSFVCHFETI